MLFNEVAVHDRRVRLREGLGQDRLLRFPGAYSPLVAMLIEELGFDGVYVSGAVIANDLGLPDVGLTTLPEVSHRARAISRVTALPAIVDVDTGFGGPMNVARTVRELDELGLAGCHLEDQVNPKRCGQLEGKQVVDTAEMSKKIRAAIEARHDPDFVVIARTDARAVEGLGASIERARAYVDAGAEMIFPEGLARRPRVRGVPRAIDVPLLANMTEFGTSELLSVQTLEDLGIDLVIYPVTAERLAMGAVEAGLTRLRDEGIQEGLLDRMQGRERLYELVRYGDYQTFDQNVYDFGGAASHGPREVRRIEER